MYGRKKQPLRSKPDVTSTVTCNLLMTAAGVVFDFFFFFFFLPAEAANVNEDIVCLLNCFPYFSAQNSHHPQLLFFPLGKRYSTCDFV